MNRSETRSRACPRFLQVVFIVAGVSLTLLAILVGFGWLLRPPMESGKPREDFLAHQLEIAQQNLDYHWNHYSTPVPVAIEARTVALAARIAQTPVPRIKRAYQGIYASASAHLPKVVMGLLPPPISNRDFTWHRVLALQFLERVGELARLQYYPGQRAGEPSLLRVIPALRTTLHDPDPLIQQHSLLAIGAMGPSAVGLCPEAAKLVQSPNEGVAEAAIQCIGRLGPSASNAVPVLIWAVMGTNRSQRLVALTALGSIGEPARGAAAAVASALSDRDECLSEVALESLAEIGFTPEESVPVLERIRSLGRNGSATKELRWQGTLATLCLWSRNSQDLALRAELVEAMRAESASKLLLELAIVGRRAAPLLPEIQDIAADPMSPVCSYARVALLKIQPHRDGQGPR